MTDTPPTDGDRPEDSSGAAGAADGSATGGPGTEGTGADGLGSAAGSDETAMTAAGAAGRRRKANRNVFARHKALTAIAVILALVLATAGGYLYWLNSQLGNIERADMGIQDPPEGTPGDNDRPLNVLLLGSDNGAAGEQSVAQDLEDGEWTPFMHRSDTIMLVHIPADRDSVQLVSIPRDTWVHIDGYPYNNERAKINAAFAFGGPSLARQTVEELTGIRIDHMAVIDWEGFRDLTSALGGVRVFIPETFYDSKQRITWEQGWQELEGAPALQYVRTRYDIPGDKQGDYGRIARQQNFLRSTMSKLLSAGTMRNPIKIGKTIRVITSHLTVDDTWGNSEIRDLALSLRSIHSDKVEFLTIPTVCCDYSNDGQSIVRLKKKQAEELFQAITDDDIAGYLQAHPEETLESEKEIN
jgi:LCP family protein required for cell wall assembly